MLSSQALLGCAFQGKREGRDSGWGNRGPEEGREGPGWSRLAEAEETEQLNGGGGWGSAGLVERGEDPHFLLPSGVQPGRRSDGRSGDAMPHPGPRQVRPAGFVWPELAFVHLSMLSWVLQVLFWNPTKVDGPTTSQPGSGTIDHCCNSTLAILVWAIALSCVFVLVPPPFQTTGCQVSDVNLILKTGFASCKGRTLTGGTPVFFRPKRAGSQVRAKPGIVVYEPE